MSPGLPDRRICLTAYDLAERFVGVAEVMGAEDNPHILAMLRLDAKWPPNDETPWCSAFVNYVCWLLRLPRSKNLRARSWLGIGRTIDLSVASPAFDVVVFNRAGGPPDPTVLDAPGHVGFFAGVEGELVRVLSGNQGNAVSIKAYARKDLLGVRRLR